MINKFDIIQWRVLLGILMSTAIFKSKLLWVTQVQIVLTVGTKFRVELI